MDASFQPRPIHYLSAQERVNYGVRLTSRLPAVPRRANPRTSGKKIPFGNPKGSSLHQGGSGHSYMMCPVRLLARSDQASGAATGAEVGPPCASIPPIAFMDKRKRPLSSASITLIRTT